MLVALGLQELDLFGIGAFGAPHSETGGEDLEGVGVGLASFDGGAFQ
jgi:hypothetical protein